MNKKNAFTLSEVLITLVVVGVVAAITVPMFIHQEGDRVNSERHANIVYKIAQATDMMKANGNLGKFSSTDEFVDELQKYLKINKRCDSNHLDECWTTSKVKTVSGEEYEVKDAKTRRDLLGDDINYPNNPNVGIVLADGANIILTYNPDDDGMLVGDTVIHEAGLLPVGNQKEEFLNYKSNTMNGLAFVFDVNGNRGPNSETEGVGSKDIRSFNGARFTDSDVCSKWNYAKKLAFGDICYFELPQTYTWEAAKTACPSGSTYAGAPNWQALQEVCQSIKYSLNNGNVGNTNTPFDGFYWTISEFSSTQAYDIHFYRCNGYGSGYSNVGYSKNGTRAVLCAGS